MSWLKGRSYVPVHPTITPQQMRPESRLGAMLSGKPRYAGSSPVAAPAWQWQAARQAVNPGQLVADLPQAGSGA